MEHNDTTHDEVIRLVKNIESEETVKMIHIFILSLVAHNSDNKKSRL